MKNFLMSLVSLFSFFNPKKEGKESLQYSNDMVKSHCTFDATLEISQALEKNIKKINEKALALAKQNAGELQNLLKYAEENGACVYYKKNAAKFLNIIGEKDGYIFPKKGIYALYLNLILNNGFKMETDGFFVFEPDEKSPYKILYSFYRWFQFKENLSGLDDKTRDAYKNLFKNNAASFEKMGYNGIMALKMAIARDREAMEFALNFARILENSKNAYEKIKKGEDGANF